MMSVCLGFHLFCTIFVGEISENMSFACFRGRFSYI